ncbi:addiction module protein [Limnoglobus roseus]|uniref:Addiction module protein n=1 Tax=Limnoglobus roseus TaxID=2598579 RepID=A0A5C1AA94_9BACT|nr:addiction module protein [Limnoglobus roseus]QEL13968.1 addiction module protein [Limnoglobus roseus]
MITTIDLTPILELPVAQRIGVVQAILDSIAADSVEPEMSEELKSELDRRIAAYRANPAAARPWEQVKASLLARRRS